MKICRRAPLISHLLFADDLILVGEASLTQMDEMDRCLHLFCRSSGQKVNKDKSRIFFSKNVPLSIQCDIANRSGLRRSDDLGLHLGIPLLHKRVNASTFEPLLEKD